MLIRANGDSSDTVTITQFFHEWTHKLSAEGYNIADASRGKPSFPKNKDALEAIENLYKNSGNVFPYGKESIGEANFRKAAAEGFSKEYNYQFSPDEMIFTSGGQFGIAACFYLIETLFPDSCVISAKPWYLNHQDISGMFSKQSFSAVPKDNKFISYDLIENDLSVSRVIPQKIEQAVKKAHDQNRKIGAFLFCNPSNPLGMVTRKQEWKGLVDLLKENSEAVIMIDDAFAEVIFDKNYENSIFHIDASLQDRIIILRSGTKALGFPGERLAVMRVPKQYHDHIVAFQSRLIGNPALSLQAGMSAAIQNLTYEKKSEISDYYSENYQFLKAKLSSQPKIKPIFKPEGGFYSLYDFSHFKGYKIPEKAKYILNNCGDEITNDVELSVSLMVGFDCDIGRNHKNTVATIPASAFGLDASKMIVRISHSPSKQDLSDIADNILLL
jgi:aspartate/methionine/tyrosine aminotransferase